MLILVTGATGSRGRATARCPSFRWVRVRVTTLSRHRSAATGGHLTCRDGQPPRGRQRPKPPSELMTWPVIQGSKLVSNNATTTAVMVKERSWLGSLDGDAQPVSTPHLSMTWTPTAVTY